MNDLVTSELQGKLDKARYQTRTDGGLFYHDWHKNVPLKLSRRFRFIMTFLFLLVGTGVVWAVMVPISGAFMGQGRLVVEGKNRVVDHLEGGIVESVLVEQGQSVEAGDVLARLDVTNASVNLTNTQRQRDIDRIKLARFLAEQSGAREIHWPDDLTEMIADDPKLAEVALSQRQEFAAKTQEINATQTILNERIETNSRLVESLTTLRNERERRLIDTKKEVDVYDDLMAKGLTTRDRQVTSRRQLASDQDQLRSTLIQINEKQSAITEAREQLDRVTSQRENEVADNILKLQSEILELTEKARAYQAQVNRSEVRAPVDGIVVNIAVNTKNQVIRAGDPLFEIFPENLPLAVEARVDPRYIDSLVLGQHVAVQFQSRERTRSQLMIDGKVTFIATDSQQDEKTGQFFYVVRATLDAASLTEYGELVPGNLATVFFQLDKQTFAQYLLDPYWDMGQRAFVG